MRKLRSKRGETIAEVLVAVAIMALAFVVLVGAVGTAAGINHKASLKGASFSSDATDEEIHPGQTVTVTMVYGGVTRTASPTVTVYNRNGYYYYE